MPIPGLPKELGEKILCCVPAIELNRLRSTSKKWNYLVKDDYGFAKIHSDKRAKEEIIILLLTSKFKISPTSLNLQGIVPSVEVKGELDLPHYNNSSCQLVIYEVFHCDGLLLCSFNDESIIVVWNPCTDQTRWIDAGKRDRNGRNYFLGYHQDKKSCTSSKSYKILSFYADSSKDYSEIYEFSSDSWRRLEHDIAPGCHNEYSNLSVSLKGSSYWFARDLTEQHSRGIHIHGFDFSTEKTSRPVPLPYERCTFETLILSVVREEKLSVLLKLEYTSKTEIWVTNKIDETNAAVVSWSKILALDLSFGIQVSDLGSFLLDEEKKVLVFCQRWIDGNDEGVAKDMVYIVGEDNKVAQVNFGVDTIDGCWPIIFNYVPRLVQIERAGGNKRKRILE